MSLTPHMKAALASLMERRTADGGFAMLPGEAPRADATAWAAMALASPPEDRNPEAIRAACARLAAWQEPDGRTPVLPEHPEACWPTAVAVLVFASQPAFMENARRGAAFLLSFSGQHFARPEGSPLSHDTLIRGWPWIAATHSWVEPTSQAVLALRAMGFGANARVEEARRMLLDRQLPGGGWNYGNVSVYGQTLLPVPESAGHALVALAGLTPRESVAKSLEYASQEFTRVRSPLAASWLAAGLAAWDVAPPDALDRLEASLKLQSRYGPYDTTLLSQLVAAGCFQTSPLFAGLREGQNAPRAT